MRGFGFGEPEVAAAASSWSGAWRRMILVARVGEEPGGDLGGGGAVVGLGDEVRGAVGDAEVGDAVGAAELEAGLEVGGGVPVAEQRPGLVEDLDPLGPGAGHELLEPPGGGDHDERQGVGVERDGGEVEDEAGPVPAERDGGGAVEHAAQRSGEELVERVGDRSASTSSAVWPAEPFDHRLGGVGDEAGDVDEGRLVERARVRCSTAANRIGVLELG